MGLCVQGVLDLQYKLRPDLCIDTVTTSLFRPIQLTNDKNKNIIIGVIYKPPDTDITTFTKNFEQLLTTLTKKRRPCYLLSDYNINLLKHDKHLLTKHFIDTLLTFGFYARKQNASRVLAIVWASVRLSVRLSVCPSVCHTRDLYQNGAS